jgi:SAM-dependent methyltransferase
MRTPRDAEIEAAQRATRHRCALSWERWDDVVQQMLEPVGEVLIRSLGIRADQHHLDIAAGTGQPGLTVAQLAPRGQVVLTASAPAMLTAARRIATVNGVDNIDTYECSADALPFPDRSFDSATCSFGLTTVPDPSRALDEFARVVRPGGRIAVSVWAEPDNNPWATIPAAAIASETSQPAPDQDTQAMFRCATPGDVATLFRAAGLHDVTESGVPVILTTDSPEEYWQLVTEHTAPVVATLGQLDENARQRIAHDVISQARKFQATGRLRIPGVARCIVGTT